MERADLHDEHTVFTRTGEFADRDAFTAAGWCAMERSLEVVGTRSAMMLVREAFYGGRRFDDLVRRTGLAETVASKRLRQLVTDGLMERQPYRVPGARTRHEYVLTERGRSLFPLFVALMNWGATNGAQGGVELAHAGCGEPLLPAVRCGAGHDVGIEETEARLAPFGPRSGEQGR
ncbi:winged helix-turn-helix transcriptional regulator [Streptomyces rishiriensis]|uniref:DNA-binding HxlR family transcriptional regulator n=1 Tax=Streptomyces rishiriensis TaxID=68264 RepID=A0ABU0NHZ1_STRRH|nr:helix-turn-helix domain-containing protein [Streptomyces rishiriensis]MDQ0578733.1 DNA-binding HxlR family transcriptional regulator [Streptomyces rishiriensis]